MRHSELVDNHTLRRRRMVGLGFLGALVFAGMALNGWTTTPVWTLFHTDEGTFMAGDPYGEWIYAVCDGEEQQVTVLKDGRLGGAEALESLSTLKFPDWCRLPTVDNPRLADWQAGVTSLQALTAAPASSARDILDTASALPVSMLYLKPVSDWIRRDAANAVAFLDAVAEHAMRFDHANPVIARARRAQFGSLVDAAVARAASSGVTAETVDRWLASPEILGSGAATLRTLATLGGSERSAAAVLERLDSVTGPQRGELYMALALRLAHDGEYAALLTRQLRLLWHDDRAAAARLLLSRQDVGVQLPIALLADFPRAFGRLRRDVQLELFTAIADELRDEPEAPLLLTRHLRDLPDIERRMAATYLLTLDGEGETAFALAVLRGFSDLHPLSRPKVAHAVMQARQFHDRNVQEACLLAIRLETRGPDRHDLLSTMLQHDDLDGAIESSIRADLS